MKRSILKTVRGAALGASALCALGLAAQADQVILDDLIVDGSACVGFDCANGESFGFDTLRLKENNLRLHFDDTSSSSSFPNNDWRLGANDTANGGANKFFLEDATAGNQPLIVEAGAGANALYVDDGGRLGLGTATPVVDIHVRTGNTPTLRLDQDGSSGFSPQTWDLAGNEANFFLRDVTNGSKLVFRTEPGAPENSLYIDAPSGNVGMGTNSPGNELHIKRSTGNIGILMESGSANQAMRLSLSDGTGTAGADEFRIVFVGTGDPKLKLDEAGNLTIAGNLVTTGGGGACTVADPCDRVFDSSVYQVPSIEDHASAMWENQHLPAVGPTLPDVPVNMTVKMLRMLNELEHAHIYIEQLNDRLKTLEAQLDKG